MKVKVLLELMNVWLGRQLKYIRIKASINTAYYQFNKMQCKILEHTIKSTS